MSYKYPLFKLNYDSRETDALISTLESKWISTGPVTSAFEEKFSSMLNVKHALALTNCTVALHLAMQLVGVGQGDEVICPSLTFVATCNAIRYMGAIPVFADIESHENPVISALDIEKRITDNTKAIIVMHYAGCMSCSIVRIQG
jgi:dTDP-4-amino-4,6-dideoxygalactose transaminase